MRLEFTATTDKPTVVQPHPSFLFQPRGQGNGDILGHDVYINSDKTTPVDSRLIPTGEYAPVDGTPFDFRKPTAIGARINDRRPATAIRPRLRPQLGHQQTAGQTRPAGARLPSRRPAASWKSGPTEPGLQFYAGNFLDGTITGKGGKVYKRRTGFCMEPQHYPDSPNKPQFPSTELKPGQTYQNTIIYKFSAPK